MWWGPGRAGAGNCTPRRAAPSPPAPPPCGRGKPGSVPRSIACSGHRLLVEVPLLDVGGHLRGHEIVDRPAFPNPAPNVGGRDREGRDLDDTHPVAETAQIQLAEVELGADTAGR